MESPLLKALELVEQAWGGLTPISPPGKWVTVVLAVCERLEPKEMNRRLLGWLDESLLGEPQKLEQVGSTTVAAVLKDHGLPGSAAGPLVRLAEWWVRQFGNERNVDSWPQTTEWLRQQWRCLPRVSLVLADRLLLFVADRAVVPLNRGLVRVVCRHGWLEPTAEYEEWQEFLVRALERDTNRLRACSLALTRVGRECCGRTAHCERCLLASLLPASGPVEPEE